MGGYNSSDDEREEGVGQQQVGTPPEYRFLSAGRRSLMDYLMSTSTASGGGGDAGVAAAAAAAAEAVAEALVEPVPELSPAVVGGSVADSASFERIGACVGCGGGAWLAGWRGHAPSTTRALTPPYRPPLNPNETEHEHAASASASASSSSSAAAAGGGGGHSFHPGSFTSLGSYLFQRDVSVGSAASSAASSMISSLGASVLHPPHHLARSSFSTATRTPSPAIDEAGGDAFGGHSDDDDGGSAGSLSLLAGGFTQIGPEDALPDEDDAGAAMASASSSSSSSSTSTWGLRALDRVLKSMLRPKTVALALLVSLNVCWRLKLSMAERRAARWEGKCLAEEARRLEAEAELARALDRLEEVLGALRGCTTSTGAQEEGRGVVVVGCGGRGRGDMVQVKLGDGYARGALVNNNGSSTSHVAGDVNGGDNLVRVSARVAAANNNNRRQNHEGVRNPHAAGLNYCTPTQERRRGGSNNEEDGGDSSNRRQHQKMNNNHHQGAENEPLPQQQQPDAYTCVPGGSSPEGKHVTLLDNCFLRVQGGPCSEEALQALQEGLGHVLAHGQVTVGGVVKGTVGLAQGVLGALEGLVDDAAAAASALSLDALADVLGVGVGGAGMPWFEAEGEGEGDWRRE